MIVVLDTNVVVSALISPFGAPGRIFDSVLAGDLQIAFDDRLLAEYRVVLQRPKFSFAPHAIEEVLLYLVQTGQAILASPLVVALPDVDDLPFLEVAAAAQAPLITGNLRHFPTDQRAGVVIHAPAAFWEFWTQLHGTKSG